MAIVQPSSSTWLVALAAVVGVTTSYVRFLSGNRIDAWFLLGLVSALLMAQIARHVVRLGKLSGPWEVLPHSFFLLFFAQELIVASFSQYILSVPAGVAEAITAGVRISLIGVLSVLLSRVARAEHSSGIDIQSAPNSHRDQGLEDSDASVSLPSALEPETSQKALGLVTRRLYARSLAAERTSRISMAAMFVLVFIGGGASVGLWMSSHVERLRDVEAERYKVLRLATVMERLEKEAVSSEAREFFQKRAPELLSEIRQNYSHSQSYEQLLKTIQTQSQTSWPDIAIRATIAVLTLLLVQIFFSVYKYHSHQAAVLAQKAESLQLIASDQEASALLRREVVKTVSVSPQPFGEAPKTAVQEVLDMASKLKEIGASQ
ncbi:MAG TPA: hypothetical protein VF017_15975 [Thermoanaerobaculia bacterium]|nr:hypothetical protein [Thermoanaerobaculia bacterium]